MQQEWRKQQYVTRVRSMLLTCVGAACRVGENKSLEKAKLGKVPRMWQLALGWTECGVGPINSRYPLQGNLVTAAADGMV